MADRSARGWAPLRVRDGWVPPLAAGSGAAVSTAVRNPLALQGKCGFIVEPAFSNMRENTFFPSPMEATNRLLKPQRAFLVSIGLLMASSIASVPAQEEGFVSLFDGHSLKGWRTADPSFWAVQDGAITARITPEHSLSANLYLIWEGGALADFELKLKHRVFGSKGINCGFQFRSRELPNHDIAGYQVDNNLDTDWLVRLYDEHGRETLAWRGERTEFDVQGRSQRSTLEKAKGPAWFSLEEWHEYHLICVGSRLTLKVDGRLAAEVIDDDPKQRDLAGILALQLHTGPPTTAQFKDIRLKVLKAATEVQSAPLPLRDKTLVTWVALADLAQRGGSALTLDDGRSHFDAIVFGELSPAKWMAGSEFFRRTYQEQQAWPEETETPGTFVQMAAAYEGQEVRLYRNGKPYASYRMATPPMEFAPEAHILFGRRHLDVGNPKQSLAGRIRDARVYDRALGPEEIRDLRPGVVTGEVKPWAWWSFADEGLREKTGRFTEIKWMGDVRLEDGCLVLGGDGATVVASAPGPEGAVIPLPKGWSASSAVPEEVLRSTRLLRERLLSDPYRPRYHFCVPEDMGQPGDPNGAFFYGGRYHLMYLYNRTGSGFSWGHISSQDLLHWRHHPDAIGPGDGDEGCFSGGAFVDTDGTAYLSYWMLWGAKGIGLASSRGPTFDNWTKSPANPVIRSTEWGVTETKGPQGKPLFLGSADPSNIWKKEGRYYLLTGNLLVLNKIGRAPDAPASEQGDRLYLFVSDDLQKWEYLHVFYQRNPQWTTADEDNMCPSFLPLPAEATGGPPSSKHLLLFISHNKGCQYYVGDYRDDRFFPNHHGRMTWQDSTFFAPEALMDAAGRQIMWAWLTDNPPWDKEKGWSGVYSLPRTLWLGEDGTLRMAPVPEIQVLRGRPATWGPINLQSGETRILEGVSGDACELQVRLRPVPGGRSGVKVRRSQDGQEETLLYYDAASRELVFDATRSGSHGRTILERAPLPLQPGETLNLRVFVDASVVEVFANDRQAICRRVYPKPESLAVALFSGAGEAYFEQVTAWDIAPTNPF